MGIYDEATSPAKSCVLIKVIIADPCRRSGTPYLQATDAVQADLSKWYVSMLAALIHLMQTSSPGIYGSHGPLPLSASRPRRIIALHGGVADMPLTSADRHRASQLR